MLMVCDRDRDRDRETIRSYLARDRASVVRNRIEADTSNRFVDPAAVKLTEVPHLRDGTLLEESRPLAFTGSHPTLIRQVWDRSLR